MDERTVTASTTIAAAPEIVFAIVANPRQHVRIDGSGSLQALVSGPDRLSRGARFVVSMRMYGVPYRVRNTVVEFEDDRLIAWRHQAPSCWRYRLEPTEDGGTRVTETWDYSPLPSVAARLLERVGFPERNRTGIADTLTRLKAAAEADQAARG